MYTLCAYKCILLYLQYNVTLKKQFLYFIDQHFYFQNNKHVNIWSVQINDIFITTLWHYWFGVLHYLLNYVSIITILVVFVLSVDYDIYS